jgi:hypothetical protein
MTRRYKDQRTENARYTELENFRKKTSVGLEKQRSDGGVSFLYDAPPQYEKWNEDRQKVLLIIQSTKKSFEMFLSFSPKTKNFQYLIKNKYFSF